MGGTLAAIVLFYALYDRSKVELTRDELVVTRFGVRHRLPRAEVGDVVRGRTHSQSTSVVEEAYYWFITDVRRQRFVALPSWLFPDDTFEDLAAALGVETRLPTGRDEKWRLSPWWMRNILVTGVVIAVVLVVGIILVWWGGGAARDWMDARVEAGAQERFLAQVEPQLTTSKFPHLDQEEQGAPASPLSVELDE